MTINDIQFTASLNEILEELQRQLIINNIPLLQKIKDSGDNIMIQCPYHGNGQERRPSAGIHKETGVFHCFACGETHSLQEVISYCLGYRDDMLGKQGWNWLLKNFATIQVEERKDVALDFSRNRNNSALGINDKRFVSEEELDKYRYYHPYWAKRKITDENIIELFDLGYDKETECITFPVRDIDGNCLFVARRSVNYKYFNYPRGAEKPLYGLYELQQLSIKYPDEIIVCESMLDALTCWQYGKYAVAMNGLGDELQFEQLRSLPCRKLILATDNDSAGRSAGRKIRQAVTNKLITEYILPDYAKDINDLTEEEFKNLVEVF